MNRVHHSVATVSARNEGFQRQVAGVFVRDRDFDCQVHMHMNLHLNIHVTPWGSVESCGQSCVYTCVCMLREASSARGDNGVPSDSMQARLLAMICSEFE